VTACVDKAAETECPNMVRRLQTLVATTRLMLDTTPVHVSLNTPSHPSAVLCRAVLTSPPPRPAGHVLQRCLPTWQQAF
jgi:hypothetical protein